MSAPKCDHVRPDGTACKNYAVAGKTRCRFHGGNARGGVLAPTFKDGRYSKYIPTGLRERFELAEKDPELLSLREEILLTDSRVKELLESLETGESSSLWAILAGLVGTLRMKINAGADVDDLDKTISAMEKVILKGGDQRETWAEIMTFIDSRRRLVEGERKRLVEMNQVITTEKALTLITALAQSVKANVTDKDALKRISRDLIRITEGHSSPLSQPGDLDE